MSEDENVLLVDLLIQEAVYGIDDAEASELRGLIGTGERDNSYEFTAACVALAHLGQLESLPGNLRARIIANSDNYVGSYRSNDQPDLQNIGDPAGKAWSSTWWGWLGWAAAAAACIALAFTTLTDRVRAPEVVDKPRQPLSRALNPDKRRQELMATAGDVVTALWIKGNVGPTVAVSGDVVWSDAKQAGFMRLGGLPVNDKEKSTYQLWIFDESQDEKTPIDGGTFDIDGSGETVIPIDAKLKTRKPKMFAITIEKAGGVVVSKREKIAAIGKIET
ncbi:MAG: anti-sigma factor [Pyrinomonadaceae bacterium]